ncbi:MULTISPECIES: hypothetical protein [Burkholderia]|nr:MULTISPECIES: hypothetical protein [Burkholderia]
MPPPPAVRNPSESTGKRPCPAEPSIAHAMQCEFLSGRIMHNPASEWNRFHFYIQQPVQIFIARGKCSDIDRIAYFRDRVEQSIPADAGRIRQAAVGLGYAQNQMKLKRQIYIIYLKG